MHAVIEYVRPLPKNSLESLYATPEIYSVTGDAQFETVIGHRGNETSQEKRARLEWQKNLFEGGCCHKCGHGFGPRTNLPLEVEYIDSRFDGAFGFRGQNNWAVLVSAEFLDLLTDAERHYLGLKPVILPKRYRRRYFEVTGPEGQAFVSVSRFKAGGWRCDACDYSTWGYWVQEMSIRNFIAKQDLPTLLSSVFTVGRHPEIHLCMTAERWRGLVGKKGTRGFTSNLIGVASEHEVQRVMSLGTVDEQLE